MAPLRRNLKYDHAFAIIRVDSYGDLYLPPQDAVTVTKVVWSREVAEVEVARLNALKKDKGSFYFWQVTRLERKAD